MLHMWWEMPLWKRLSLNKGSIKANKKKRNHAHTVEDDEPTNKRTREYSSSDEEYVLILSLTSTIIHGRNDWLVDSGASKHMTWYKYSLINLWKQDSTYRVKLGDDSQYPIKWIGESSYQLDSSKPIKMKDVLSVLGLKKKILSISSLDAKGFWVAFVDGQVVMWPRRKTIDDETIIGEQEGGLYKLKG